MSGIDNIENWDDARLAEHVDDSDELGEAKYLERRRRVKKAEEERREVEAEAARRKAEEAKRRAEEVAEAAAKRQVSLFGGRRGCWLTEQAEQVAEQQRAGAGGAEKGKEKALPECEQCERHGLECERGSGKSTSCKACIEAKAKCMRPGTEGAERATKRRRKAEEESPRGKRKRAQTTEESEAGPSGTRGAAPDAEGWAEAIQSLTRALHDIRDGMWKRLDRQNALLAQLVELKTEEVYGGWLEESDEDLEVGAEVEVEEMVEMEVSVDEGRSE